MKFEVAYISVSGNTERLAHGIADSLPHRKTFVTDLATENTTQKANVYLIGFALSKGALPLKVMDVLEELHGKTILFFVTGGFEPIAQYQEAVERKLLPFLPDDCDYRGVFVCQGKIPEEVLEAARIKLREEPDNEAALKIIEDAELTESHPNKTDIQNACHFVREKLGLK